MSWTADAFLPVSNQTSSKCDWLHSYLQDDGDDDERSDGVHGAAVVGEERLATAPGPDVEFLRTVVVVVVGRVIGQVMLNARPGGSRITAAERDAVHQELPLHITQDTTTKQIRQRGQWSKVKVSESIHHFV